MRFATLPNNVFKEKEGANTKLSVKSASVKNVTGFHVFVQLVVVVSILLTWHYQLGVKNSEPPKLKQPVGAASSPAG